MADRPARKAPQTHLARVVRTERLTPHMQRIVLGGEGLAHFSAGEFTDHYVKVLFPPEGVTYPEPFDIAAIRAELPRDRWPVTRTYTVRRWDAEAREITVDFVVHGDKGLAGPWASAAVPGDEIRLLGPGGAYAPAYLVSGLLFFIVCCPLSSLASMWEISLKKRDVRTGRPAKSLEGVR